MDHSVRTLLVLAVAIAFTAAPGAAEQTLKWRPGKYVHASGSVVVTRLAPNRVHLDIQTVSGPTAHVCEFNNDAHLEGGKVTYLAPAEDPSACRLEIRLDGTTLHVSQQGSCECGARGTMEGTYWLEGTFRGPAPAPFTPEAKMRLSTANKALAKALNGLRTAAQGRHVAALPSLAAAQAAWEHYADAQAAFVVGVNRALPGGGEQDGIDTRTSLTDSRRLLLAGLEAMPGPVPTTPSLDWVRALPPPSRRDWARAESCWLAYQTAELSFEEAWGVHGGAGRLRAERAATISESEELWD
ncbi:MAG: hypothetical protein JWM80_5784, partial [Cyanobacteria bacterium RYN_339]|nr:hypothetical protein [Cyanobacteria bacterium RYN_339]